MNTIKASRNNDHNSHALLYKLLANRIARENGHSKVTKIVRLGYSGIVETVRSGYRKYSDGSYVNGRYRKNFGWKNTYYQPAICIVSIA